MVVRMRKNRSQTRQRRSHQALTAPALSVCSNCGAEHRPHHMCRECGFYNGKQVMDILAEKAARAERIKAKQDRIKADQASLAPEGGETAEAVNTDDETKAAKEENTQDKEPEKKPE